ncbi:Helicase required for RNAi-mediated heterochromatin assembly 1 [Pseudocercospora fuligena]|uniref:Helicase required for RNAi-mediated heterochromatin assembly 1 n=1 Tax=Pseudocercospora fuligena TaxID=685502 RepID=A0A8H6RNB4_9PEZI|nr:Helicase required for RNAi-mediated heterochromatin assembly 1 [Pseudocercospora fuligena]
MNEGLQERFGRSRQAVRHEGDTAKVWLLPPKLNPKVREYFEPAEVEGGAWLSKPEIPTSAEVLDLDTVSSSSSDVIELEPNRPVGPWQSKEQYLSTLYELYREDALRGLREAVSMTRCTPHAAEGAFAGKVGIYDKVHICGATLSTRGFAVRVTFSLFRTGSKVLWEQSKRLISGSLVVLTPKSDMFRSRAIVATVAARPLDGLQQNPPELDLAFARPEELELDPAMEYVMVEDRGGLFEANRHTLVGIQRMMREPFPLAEHFVGVQRRVSVPEYVKAQPKRDLSSVLLNKSDESFENVDIVKHWPSKPNSTLDASQLEALHRILTKRLAIVQGPPGTGKTHVSVQAVKLMLKNWQKGDPPIIIACQTNHAIDQFLRHIAEFEEEFARLGGHSKDKDVVKKRTLYALRYETSENPPSGCLQGWAKKRMSDLQKEISVMLSPLQPGPKPMDFRVLQEFKILTKKQADSLESGASRWVQDKKTNPNQARSPFTIWLADKLRPVPVKQPAEEFGFDFEEADLEFEQLKELEAENAAKDDEDFDTLRGPYLPLADNFTCRPTPGMNSKAKDFLKEQDMWKIPEASRPSVYRYLQAEMKRCITIAVREKVKKFDEEAKKRKIGMWECDENILKKQKIIGMTTTGLSKYRGLISALQPRIVLIEEAAETLEAPVTVGCMPSVQHLVLVGDHKQLRPHTHVPSHENEPFFLNVSLFERMVNNGVEFSTLTKQRRMIPEIRRILHPIYGNLIKDHSSVADKEHRPDVPGMGGVNSWWFTHQWAEQRDDLMSCFNPMESGMIVGFVEYLVYNGMETEDITVLTFYNGQRKRILSELRQRPALGGRIFNVVTVDSYQGEENKVVILSLARSNDSKQIGFLGVDNRVCVALSRAQCGFYIFGNGKLLYDAETQYKKTKKKQAGPDGTVRKIVVPAKPKTWTQVITIMAGSGQASEVPQLESARFDQKLPVRCHKHNKATDIKEPEDWEKFVGGCELPCGEVLSCGHPCPVTCHPFSHDHVSCDTCRTPKPTDTEFPLALKDISNGQDAGEPGTPSRGSVSDANSWNSWASSEEERVKKAKAAYNSKAQRTGSESEGELLDLGDATSKLTFGLDGAYEEHSMTEKDIGNGRKKWNGKLRNGSGKSLAKFQEDWSSRESLLN